MQLFRGAASPEDVEKVSTIEAGCVDYLGVEFFSKVFLGLWHDVYGNEVRTTAQPSYNIRYHMSCRTISVVLGVL